MTDEPEFMMSDRHLVAVIEHQRTEIERLRALVDKWNDWYGNQSMVNYEPTVRQQQAEIERLQQTHLTRSDLLVLAAALDHALKTKGPFVHREDWEHAAQVENKLDQMLDQCDAVMKAWVLWQGSCGNTSLVREP